MSIPEIKNINYTEKNFTSLLQEKVIEISQYLDFEKHPKSKIIVFQSKTSEEKIPSYGRQFGVKLTDELIIFANWLYDLPVRERSYLIEMLVVREAFRICLATKCEFSHEYPELSEVVLNCLAVIWLAFQYDFKISSPPILYMRSHTNFEDTHAMRQNNWEWFLIDCIKYGIRPFDIFNELILTMKEGRERNLSLKETAKSLELWYENQKKGVEYIVFPLAMDQRGFEIVSTLCKLGVEAGSAVKVGKIIGKSYNVINQNFIMLMTKYNVFWRAIPNHSLLRLYQYRFSLTLTNKEDIELIIDYFKTIPYIREIETGTSNGLIIIAGKIESPLIIGNNLQGYFSKLKKKGIFQEFFLERVRRMRMYFAITKEDMEKTETNYRKLLTNPEEFNLSILKILDQSYNISDLPKIRKTAFNKNILTFLALIRARYLGKAHYMYADMHETYEFVKDNGIDSADTLALKNFINQLDIRCRRLSLLDYYLSIKSLGNFSFYLNIEIEMNQDDDRLKNFLDKIIVFSGSGMIINEFLNRTVIQFPNVRMDTIFQKIMNEELKKYNFKYKLVTLSYYKKYIPPLVLEYHKYYDFTEEKWKI